MKNISRVGKSLAALCFVLIFAASCSSGGDIVGVSDSSQLGWKETDVLLRDGTFEQFFTDSKTGAVTRNVGTWNDSLDDIETKLFLGQTGTKLEGKYLKLKNKLDLHGGNLKDATKVDISLEPAFAFQPAVESQIKNIDKLRKLAKPVSSP